MDPAASFNEYAKQIGLKRSMTQILIGPPQSNPAGASE
jgi:hypothetical protein